MVYPFAPFLWPLLILVALWDMVWKGIGLWKSARNSQLGWFVAILIFNTAGILPIIYLLFFQRQAQQPRLQKGRKSR